MEALAARADGGDPEAAYRLIDLCLQENELGEAVDWADRAAASGEAAGLYRAARAHACRMRRMLQLGIPLWSLLTEDALAVQQYAGILLDGHEGLSPPEGSLRSRLLALRRDGLYCEALACYCDRPGDPEKTAGLLQHAAAPRETALLGAACAELGRYQEAARCLNAVLRDADYASAEKGLTEQVVYATAMTALASMNRHAGRPGKAVAALRRGLAGVADEGLRETLRRELARYRKAPPGGWRYVG